MNLKQIKLFREMVEHYEQNIQWWNASEEIEKVGYNKVRYAKETLADLELDIPTQRQINLLNDILDYKHLITKNEFILEKLNFFKSDGCSERNRIGDLEHLIKKATDEIEQIHIDRIGNSRDHYLNREV